MSQRRIRVGLKTASGANVLDGLSEQIERLVEAGIAPTIMGIGSAGPVYAVQEIVKAKGSKEVQAATCLHYREVGLSPFYNTAVTYIDVPLYELNPKDAADIQYDIHRERWLKAKELDPAMVWYGITNEPASFLEPDERYASPYRRKVVTVDPANKAGFVWDNSEWMAAHARRLLALAKLDNNRRLTVLEWTTGEPNPALWGGPVMRALAEDLAADPLHAALGIHEYSLAADLKPGPYLIGRYREAYGVADTWRRVTKIVTEFGWGKDGDLIPDDGKTGATMVEDALKAYDASVIGLGLWTANKGGKGSAWSGAARDVHRIYGELVTRAVASGGERVFWPLQDPDPVPVPEPAVELLENGDFGGGWYHINDSTGNEIRELQIPSGWELQWEENEPTGFGDQPWDVYVRPEVRVLNRGMLPAAEHKDFILGRDDWTLKIFKGFGCWSVRLIQRVHFPQPGRYRLTVPLFVDMVKAYKDGRKVWADDGRDCQIALWIGGQYDPAPDGQEWHNLAAGRIHRVSTEYMALVEGEQYIEVHIRANFALANSGVFTDGWELAAVPGPKPDPEPDPQPAQTVTEHMLAWSKDHDPDNSDAALRKALRSGGTFPYGVEARTTYDGTRYAVQTGMNWSFAPPLRAVAFAPTSNYNDVQIVYDDRIDEPNDGSFVLAGVKDVAISQRDPRWAAVPFGGPDADKTYAQWACLAASYCMMARYLNLYPQEDLRGFVQLMREKRVLTRFEDAAGVVRYNTAAHALETMYPRDIDSLGWVSGQAADLAERVKSRLQAGMPVPVRVDFNPATPAAEQHWPLIVGWDAGGQWLMLDPYDLTPSVRPVSDSYDITGEDVLEALLYARLDDSSPDDPEPPAATISARSVFWPPAAVADGYLLPYLLQHDRGHQEVLQTLVQGDVVWFLKGDGNGHWEKRLWSPARGVLFPVDTSHGTETYYTLTELAGGPHAWMPAHLDTDTWYHRAAVVSIRHKANCAAVYAPYTDETWIQLSAVLENVTLAGVKFPTVYDVLVTRDTTPSSWIERYWYGYAAVGARHVGGLLQWWNNAGEHSVFNGIATPQDLQMKLVKPACLEAAS